MGIRSWLIAALGRCRHKWEYDWDYDPADGKWKDFRICQRCDAVERITP